MWRIFPILILLIPGCGNKNPQTAEDLYGDTLKALRLGELERAHNQAEHGAAAWKEGAGPPWPLQFKLLQAEILIAQGKSQEALKLLTSPPFDKPLPAKFEARSKMIQGNACLRIADYNRASLLLEEAHRLASADSDAGVRLETEVLKGTLLSRVRKLDEAELVFRDALSGAVEHHNTYIQASALNSLGMIRVRAFRFDEAIPYFERALPEFEQIGAQIYSAAVLGNLALCHFRLGDFEKGLSLQLRANQLHERAGAHFYLQKGLGLLGLHHLTRGNWTEAAEYSRHALSLARQTDARYDTSVWASNLAVALAEMNQWDEAERLNNEALQLKRELNDTANQAFCKLNAGTIAAGRRRYDDAAALLTELAGSTDNQWLLWSAHAELANIYSVTAHPEQASAHFAKAIETIEKTRSGLLQPDYKITFLRRLISFYQDYVQYLVDQGEPAKALRVAESSRARILAERLESGNPRRHASDVNFRNIARRSNSAFLAYWLAPQRSFLWIITPGRMELLPLPPEREIAELVDAHNKTIANLRDVGAISNGPGRRLFEILVAPAQPLLDSVSNIVLVPDGALHSLNFETLPASATPPRYWIEDVTVSIAPSISVLSAAGLGRTADHHLLLIGDPDPANGEFPKLRHASAEIGNISQRFPESVVYTGPKACPSAYGEAHPGRFSMIHFAAHAAANPESPLDSAVILSPRNDSFKLYARDVMRMPLSADLVTISACRSAGARAFSGEGLVGFAWAFLQAGASNVIAGLWDVGDASTAELMDHLYSALALGSDPAAALREAKLALIRSSGNYRKPFYWGPFQIYTRQTPRNDS